MKDLPQILQKNWNSLLKRHCDNSDLISYTFNSLIKEYSKKSRYYHNIEHISQMLDFVEERNKHFNDLDNVLFAIWFHDYVYNPIKTNNEQKSAESSKIFLKAIDYKKENYKKVYSYILRTENHSEFKKKDSDDLRLFLDSDLHILASKKEEYAVYADKIRKEYSFLSDTQYNKGRIKVLKNLLKNKHIFHYKENRKMYDMKAKENIQNEIEMLSKKL